MGNTLSIVDLFLKFSKVVSYTTLLLCLFSVLIDNQTAIHAANYGGIESKNKLDGYAKLVDELDQRRRLQFLFPNP